MDILSQQTLKKYDLDGPIKLGSISNICQNET